MYVPLRLDEVSEPANENAQFDAQPPDESTPLVSVHVVIVAV